MDVDLIKNILGLVPSIITFLIALIALLSSRTKETNAPIDSSSLKALKIIRHPIDENKFRTIQLLASLYYVGVSVLFLIWILFFGYLSDLLRIYKNSTISNISSAIFFASFILFIVYIYIQASSYKNRRNIKRATDARYFLYKNVDILIDADYHYIFNKCHEALKSMKLKIIEVDEEKGTLEAIKFGPFVNTTAIVKVEIKERENSYVITLDYARLPKHKENLQQRSKFSNRFIDLLISKPKSLDEKSNIEIKASTNE